MTHLALALLFTLNAVTENVTTLDRGHSIERELNGGEVHAYGLVLQSGDFMRLVVDQRGIDVVVTAYGPDQKQFAEVDSPNGANGPEPVEFVVPVAGTYRFEVRPLEKTAPPGRYEVRIEQWMTADEYAGHLAAIKAAEEAASSAVRRAAIPLRTVEAGNGFTDMERLGQLVGDSHIVALGEATHGSREFFQLKHRIFEFLAERKGFTVFAIEATMPESFDVDDYVLTGKGDARKALAGLYFWTWNTEEVLDLIEWMRRYNANPEHQRKLRFYGFDMQSAQRALRVTLQYLDTVDPGAGTQMRDSLDPLTNAFTDSGFDALSEPAKVAALASVRSVIERMDARRDDYVKKSGRASFEKARQHAEVLAQNIERRSSTDRQARDRFMARNVEWILRHEGPDAKMVLWAHDGHVRTAPEGSMGSFLRKMFGKDMVVFGFAFNQGSFQAYDLAGAPGTGVHAFTVSPAPAGSLDAILAAAKLPIAIVDLRGLPDGDPLAKWLEAPRLTRIVGSMYSTAAAERFFAKESIREEYDALVFVEKTNVAKANPGANLVRFERLAAPENLDFENGADNGVPVRWAVSPDTPLFDYELTAAEARPHTGRRSARIHRSAGKHYGEGVGILRQQIDAAPYRGKRIRLVAFSRSEGSSPVFVFLNSSRSFLSRSPVGFDERRRVTSQEWQQYAMEGNVPADAEEIAYGLVLTGDGSAWIDTLSIEVVDGPQAR